MNTHLLALCSVYLTLVVFCAIADVVVTRANTRATRRCPPGQEPNITSSSKHTCMSCQEGHYSEHYTSKPCKPCRRCKKGESVFLTCSPLRNRHCKKVKFQHSLSTRTKKKKKKHQNQVDEDVILFDTNQSNSHGSDSETTKHEYGKDTDLNIVQTNSKSNGNFSQTSSPVNPRMAYAIHLVTQHDGNEKYRIPSNKSSELNIHEFKYSVNNSNLEVQEKDDNESLFLNNLPLMIEVIAGTSLIWVVLGFVFYAARRYMKSEAKAKRKNANSIRIVHISNSLNTVSDHNHHYEMSEVKKRVFSRSASIRSFISLTPLDTVNNVIDNITRNSAHISTADSLPEVDTYYRRHGIDSFLEEECDMFGRNWQFQAIFDSFGGILEKEDSAVRLTFPVGSLPANGSFSVKGSIYTCPRQVRQQLQIPDDVELASPVAEYVITGSPRLNKHAVLRMPTCLNRYTDKVIVYCFQSASANSETIVLREITVPHKSFLKHEDMYYEFGDEGYVYIYTIHFTGFIVCKHCKNEQDTSPPLYAVMFGQFGQQSGMQYAKLRLYIIDAYHSIQDCLENLKHQEHEVGRVLKEYKKLDFEEDVLNTSKLLIKLEFADVKLRHRLRKDGKPMQKPRKIVDVKTVMRCCRRQDFPKSVEWDFEVVPGVSGVQSYDCYIDIVMTNKVDDISDNDWENEDDRTTITYVEKPPDETQPIMERQVRSTLTPEQQATLIIKSLTSQMTRDQVYNFAIEAGLSDTDFDDSTTPWTNSLREYKFQLLTRIKQMKGCADFCRITKLLLQKLKFNDILQNLEISFEEMSLPSMHSDCSSDTLNAEELLSIKSPRNSPDGATLERKAPTCPVEATGDVPTEILPNV